MLEQTTLPSFASTLAPPRGHAAVSAEVALAIKLVRGRRAILAAQPLLAELARRSGQSGEVESLRYFLQTRDARKKMPWLVLVGRSVLGGLEGAVLIFEYTTWSGGTELGATQVFATADATGRRTVIALRKCRAQVAGIAARALMDGGARVVHIAFSETHGEPESGDRVAAVSRAKAVVARALERGLSGVEWRLTETEMPLYLPLYDTFDRTVSRIGQRTRSNLRYYRRRCELDLGSRFVAEAEVSRDEFLRFNRACSFAVDEGLAAWRYETLLEHRSTTLHGVVDRDGRWLSLVGMRSYERAVEIDWQMNRADLPAYSLATVMRSYLIEYEIRRGTTRLYIEGGTPQPIGRSFLKERVAELTVARRSPAVWILRRFAGRLFPAKNRLAQVLGDRRKEWIRARQ